MPTRSASSKHLGKFRSVYQNQLRLGGEVVVQQGVPGRMPSGRIGLKAGWHPLSLRLGSSPAGLTVTHPDGQTVALGADGLKRAAGVAFPARSPAADLIAAIDFTQWDGKPGFAALDERCRVWFADFARREKVDGRMAMVSQPFATTEGPGGVDINMTRGTGRVPLKLQQLNMLDPEFSVGLWFRSETGDGQLFGKQGLTAFGKRYRTVWAELRNNQLHAGPGALEDVEIKPGTWHHVVLAATPNRIALYLDGRPVSSAPGTPDLATDALDILADHPGAIAGLTIHNRELTPAEIRSLFEKGPP